MKRSEEASDAGVEDKSEKTVILVSENLCSRMTMKSSHGAPASFVSKPPRGWLHPDHLFAREGINYAVRYIGCVDVNTSMKVLNFETRSVEKSSFGQIYCRNYHL